MRLSIKFDLEVVTISGKYDLITIDFEHHYPFRLVLTILGQYFVYQRSLSCHYSHKYIKNKFLIWGWGGGVRVRAIEHRDMIGGSRSHVYRPLKESLNLFYMLMN